MIKIDHSTPHWHQLVEGHTPEADPSRTSSPPQMLMVFINHRKTKENHLKMMGFHGILWDLPPGKRLIAHNGVMEWKDA